MLRRQTDHRMTVRINEARRPSGFFVREIGFSAPPGGLRVENVLSPIDVIHFVIRGRGSYCAEEIGPGRGFLIVKNQPYSFAFDPEDPWAHYWIGLDGTETVRVLEELGMPLVNRSFACPWLPAMLPEFERMVCEQPEDEDEGLRMLGFFYRVMSFCARGQGAPQAPEEAGARYVDRAVRYIQERYYEEMSVEDMARAANVSSRYLCRRFVQRRGCSPSEYLIAYRLQRASVLLRESALPVGEVARTVGYREPGYFSASFRRAYGRTPSQFRAEEQETRPSGGGTKLPE